MTTRDADSVRAAMQAADPAVRAEAALIAGEDMLVDLADALCLALADEDAEVRRTAARGLSALHAFRGQEGDPEVAAAVAALASVLRDPEEGVRRAAAAALGLVGDPSAVSDLVAVLDDPTLTELAEEGLRGLGPLALHAAEELAVVVRRGEAGADSAARVLIELGPGALPVLGRLLDEEEAVDRVLDVLAALGVWAAPLVPEVTGHAHAPGDRGARAARVLIAIGPDAWDALSEVFDAGRPEARSAALAALDLAAQPDLVGLAVRALFDDDARVRVAALVSLSGAPVAARPFAAEIGLLAADPEERVRTAAVSLLALLG